MEQSVNTFQDGLQLDSHPMVQSNTSLSNALNATFITMNGNEVILQNDMGNRRIDKAYLPAGYVPVGIKEYGGIIYVAAHNPLTHIDQIGSFPSPERNIGEEYPELSTDIKDNFKDYFKSTSIEKLAPNKNNPNNKVYLTNVESKLLPLAEDRILHAGDKFTVYFVNDKPTSFSQELISNYDSGDNFWNKQYTLYLGVLNSQNEFVDITKSLERWKNGTIIDTSDLSEEEKFNTGYFIPILKDKMDVVNTEDDSEYLRNRETKAVNTYAYKLVGPLSLKIGLNTPQNFDYEIRGERNDDSYYVRITSTITYNCPKPTFDFYALNSEQYKTETFNESEDKINNLKIATIVKKYKIIPDGKSDLKNYGYYIGVRTFNDDTNYYLEKFWNTGTLDLTLFGSGNAQLTGWRFYNNWDEESDDAECYLSCNMVAYPKLDEEISNLEIAFSEDSLDDGDHISWSNQLWTTLSPLVGKVGMFKSSWKELGGLQPQTLYYVHFRYKSTAETGANLYYGHKYVLNATRFLTTNLFNPCYTLGSDDFVSNFNEFFAEESENSIVTKYKTINIYPNFQIKLNAIKKSTNSSDLKLVRNSNNDFVFDAETTYNISGSILNEELVYDSIKYPKDEVIINSADSSISYETKFSFKFNDSITSEKKGDDSLSINPITPPPSSNVILKKFEITPKLSEHFKSKVTNNFTLNNIFCTIEDAIQSQENSDEYKYSEFMLSFHTHDGGEDDEKRIDLLCLPKEIVENSDWKIGDNPAQTLKLYGDWGQAGILKKITELNEKYYLKVDHAKNDENSYQVEYDQDIVNELSRKILLKNQNFSYLFIDPNDFDSNASLRPNDDTMYDGTLIFAQEKNPDRGSFTTTENCSLLFWRNAGDTWAIYPTLLSKTANKSSLIRQLGQIANLYYAYELEKEYNDNDGYYVPDLNNYIYNNSYSVDLTIECSVSYGGNTSVEVKHGEVFKYMVQQSKTLSTTVTLKVDTLEQILPIIFNQPYSNIIDPKKEANGGKFLDYKGNTLNPQEIYYCKDNNFYKLQNNKSFRVGMIDSDSEYRLLFPYSVIPGGHQYKYMITGQGDDGESTSSNHTVRLRLSQNVDITNKIQPFNDLIAGAVPTNLYSESTTERNLHTPAQALIPNSGSSKIIDNYIYYNNEIIVNSNNNIISDV